MSEELETKVENAEVQANAEVVAPAENKKDAKGSRKPRRENRLTDLKREWLALTQSPKLQKVVKQCVMTHLWL